MFAAMTKRWRPKWPPYNLETDKKRRRSFDRRRVLPTSPTFAASDDGAAIIFAWRREALSLRSSCPDEPSEWHQASSADPA
jgi:hypothetical protein